MDASTYTEKHADIHRRGMRHHADIGIGIEAIGRFVDQHIAEVGHGVGLAC